VLGQVRPPRRSWLNAGRQGGAQGPLRRSPQGGLVSAEVTVAKVAISGASRTALSALAA